MINSTEDARVVNNVVRHEYRVLDANEKANMKMIKDCGLDFLILIEQLGLEGREISIGKTKIEEAVMWCVRGITK